MAEQSSAETAQSKPVDPSNLLYHYTDQNGLLGIIDKGTIWATHYRYLNDISEFQKAKRILLPLLQRYSLEDVDKDRRSAWQELENIVNTVHENFCVYITSFTCSKKTYFSENGIEYDDESDPGDRLSQWRGYARDTQGVSFGFDASTNAIRDLDLEWKNEELRVQRIRCEYKDCNQRSIIEEVVNKLKDAITAHSDKVGYISEIDLFQSFKAFLGEFLVASSRFKDKAFAEENEWRFVIPRDSKNLAKAKFRDSKYGLAPYIEIPLHLDSSSSLLRRIVIGPGPHNNDCVESVKMLLGKKGIKGVEVVPSTIPYRNWSQFS